MSYKIIAIIAPSGAGKDSLLKRIFSSHPQIFHKIVRSTTRPRRDNESLEDYHFLTDWQWTDQSWLIFSKFNEWKYGVAVKDLEESKINIGIFTKNEINFLKSIPSNYDYKVIYLKVSDKARLSRAINREKNPNCHEICRRFLADEEDFKNIDSIVDYTYVNETLEDQDMIVKDIEKIGKEMINC